MLMYEWCVFVARAVSVIGTWAGTGACGRRIYESDSQLMPLVVGTEASGSQSWRNSDCATIRLPAFSLAVLNAVLSGVVFFLYLHRVRPAILPFCYRLDMVLICASALRITIATKDNIESCHEAADGVLVCCLFSNLVMAAMFSCLDAVQISLRSKKVLPRGLYRNKRRSKHIHVLGGRHFGLLSYHRYARSPHHMRGGGSFIPGNTVPGFSVLGRRFGLLPYDMYARLPHMGGVVYSGQHSAGVRTFTPYVGSFSPGAGLLRSKLLH